MFNKKYQVYFKFLIASKIQKYIILRNREAKKLENIKKIQVAEKQRYKKAAKAAEERAKEEYYKSKNWR